jgi:hypothetical protein
MITNTTLSDSALKRPAAFFYVLKDINRVLVGFRTATSIENAQPACKFRSSLLSDLDFKFLHHSCLHALIRSRSRRSFHKKNSTRVLALQGLLLKKDNLIRYTASAFPAEAS